MRKLIIGAVTAAALLGAPAVAGAATAPSPSHTPVTDPLHSGKANGSVTVPAGQSCKFAVGIAVVANNRFQDVTPLPDKSMLIKITGKLVLSFKNDTTGKTIQENVGGPTTETVSPNGSGAFQVTGPNWLAFGPTGQKKTGEPGLVFFQGLVTVTFANGTPQKFSLNGTQENGCTLLS
jgi:hypothetical protein